jgi:hypothetical protein
MLSPILSFRKPRRFITYDLEWYPGSLELRLVGVFDGKRYRSYTTIDAFFAGELTSVNRACWFYAHAGGIADVQYVMEEIIKRDDVSVRASLSGSSAIIVHVRKGKNAWHFIDSYRLLPVKLREIGKWIGLEKGGATATANASGSDEIGDTNVSIFHGPIEQLREYNEQDCRILWFAIDAFEDAILQLGGELKMTLASTAMNLFRRRFLSKEIETSSRLNRISRESYIASRVEVFTRECEEANYYDVNSSFPYAMTLPCPGNLLWTDRSLPDDESDTAYVTPCMVDADIFVPETYLPPLPKRQKERIYFPFGAWRSWLTGVDLALLLREGGKIIKVHEVMHFEPFDDLREHALTLYQKRMTSDDPFTRQVYKILLNATYGKFGESPDKQQLLVNPLQTDETMEMLLPGVYLQNVYRAPAHAHVPIAAWITATARHTLYDFLSQCRAFHYCDTDGFSTEDTLEVGVNIGELKLEKVLREGQFLSPKLYHLGLKDGQDLYKAKGFSKMDYTKFQRLLEGLDVEIVRMNRLKELYRKGITKPQETLIRKKLRQKVQAKRFFYPDGHSRPWHVEELEK